MKSLETQSESVSTMEVALDEARRAAELGEVPVGAVILHKGEIIARAHNLTRSQHDPTAHAEIVVIRAAAKLLGADRLTECDLYVTLEPCAMCAAAISHARIRRLYYGASDAKGGAVLSGVRFFHSASCHHTPEIYDGIAETQSSQLLRSFFGNKR